MEFVGLLLQKVSDKEGEGRTGHWRTAQFLLQTVEMYPKKMVVDVRDGAFRRIDEFEILIGRNVRVEFDINAREYPENSGKWFNTITAYRIYDLAQEAAKVAEHTLPPQQQIDTEEKSDLPF